MVRRLSAVQQTVTNDRSAEKILQIEKGDALREPLRCVGRVRVWCCVWVSGDWAGVRPSLDFFFCPHPSHPSHNVLEAFTWTLGRTCNIRDGQWQMVLHSECRRKDDDCLSANTVVSDSALLGIGRIRETIFGGMVVAHAPRGVDED